MRVLVCGSRTFEDEHEVLGSVVRGLAETVEIQGWMTLIHGGARGADTIARRAGESSPIGCSIEAYPADWNKYGKQAGWIRNQQMLDEGNPDIVLAFVDKPLAESRGTADMVRRSRQAGLPVYVIEKMN